MTLQTFGLVGIDSEEEFLQPLAEITKKTEERTLKGLFFGLSKMCARAEKTLVLMIDEVDSASNNQVFTDFLAQLRMYYLNRDRAPIFHSVILAGVYDIKNLKLKLRSESEHPMKEARSSLPIIWNIIIRRKDICSALILIRIRKQV